MGQNANVVNSSRGRPAGGGDARERLLEAATELFVAQGYTRTSSRSIAAKAGVSHTLVNYYFGSKEGLFAEVMAINLRPSLVIASAFGGPARRPLERAQHILATAMAVWDQPQVRDSISALIGDSIADEAVRALVAEFFAGEILGHLREQVDGPDASRRALGLACTMAGIIFTRYVMRIEPFASMAQHEVVRTFAPSLAVHLR